MISDILLCCTGRSHVLMRLQCLKALAVLKIPCLNISHLHRNFDERPILVSTLDGKISAIDKVSGKLLWTFDSEHALIQASASDTYGFSVVPGVQGELYTQEKGHEDEGFQVCLNTWSSVYNTGVTQASLVRDISRYMLDASLWRHWSKLSPAIL